uniref:NFU1 iron-sulfur cluster scaffold homolog, mitochondrial n=1 Tax=Caenorhabditis tropicalis TaxID=1561998 RepID=A0A1I7UNH5_9PELO
MIAGQILSRLSRSALQAVRSMYIQVQETPNPLSLKFLPGQQLLPDASKTYDFSSAATAKQSPLAVKLLRVDGVKRVFFGEDFVTVTKADEQVDWALLRPEIFSTIADHLQTGKPVINEETTTTGANEEEDNEVVMMIKEILETRIRPMVQEDGGDITYVGFDETSGVVKLKMQGSCTGCPSSGVTLKNGIENMLTFYVPEVKEVIEVKDESDDLVERELKKFEQSRGIKE